MIMKTLATLFLFCAFSSLAQLNIGTVTFGTPASFSPTNISGLVRWYDAQQLTGLTNMEVMSSWPDATGTTNLTQSVAGTNPKYVLSNSTFGNKPCVLFYDASQALTLTNYGPALTAATAFIVAYNTNQPALKSALEINNYLSAMRNLTNKWLYRSSTTYYEPVNSDSSTPGVFIFEAANTSSAKIRTQSGAWSANFDPDDSYNTQRNFAVGGATASGLFIGEVLIYNVALSDANVNLVGNYLANKWNFTWTDL